MPQLLFSILYTYYSCHASQPTKHLYSPHCLKFTADELQDGHLTFLPSISSLTSLVPNFSFRFMSLHAGHDQCFDGPCHDSFFIARMHLGLTVALRILSSLSYAICCMANNCRHRYLVLRRFNRRHFKCV